MNKCKRLNAGAYEYKGWEIYKIKAGQWNITEPGEMTACDAAATKAEAVKIIDSYTGTEK